jgi:hypothetical protein
MRLRLPVRGRGRLAAFVVVVLGLVAGGIAYASIPDSSGVIHGCFKATGGALRVIDTGAGGACNSSERVLDWNQAGPQGATGPAGPAGPSEGGQAVTFSDTAVAAGDFNVPVAGTQISNLPEGNYIYSASVYITPSGGPTVAACNAQATGTSGGASTVGDTTVSSPQWIPVVGILFLAGAGGAQILCHERGHVNGYGVHGALTVTCVGTIHSPSNLTPRPCPPVGGP